jgi:hypothetical protein
MTYRPIWETGVSAYFKGLALGAYFRVADQDAVSGIEDAGWLPHCHIGGAWVSGPQADEIVMTVDNDLWVVAHRFRRKPEVEYVKALGRELFGMEPYSMAVRAPGYRIPVWADPNLYPVTANGVRAARVWPHEEHPPYIAVVGGIAHELCLRAVSDDDGVAYFCDLEVGGPRYIRGKRRSRRATYLGDFVRSFAMRMDDRLLVSLAVQTLYGFVMNMPGLQPSTGRPGNRNQAARVVWLPGGLAGFLSDLPGAGGFQRFVGFGAPPWTVPVTKLGVAAALREAGQYLTGKVA